MQDKHARQVARKRRAHLSKTNALEETANAKRSSYDPRKVRENEKLRMAKTVNKYKKLKARMQRASGAFPARSAPVERMPEEAGIVNGTMIQTPSDDRLNRRKDPQTRNENGIHVVARDGAAIPTKTGSAVKISAADQSSYLGNARKERKLDRKMHFRRNKAGQPLMKYRVQKLLSKLSEINDQ